MPIYEYKALNGAGSGVTGILDADSPKDARLFLRNKKLHVTEIREAIQGGSTFADALAAR